jgi:hypothetical protein
MPSDLQNVSTSSCAGRRQPKVRVCTPKLLISFHENNACARVGKSLGMLILTLGRILLGLVLQFFNHLKGAVPQFKIGLCSWCCHWSSTLFPLDSGAFWHAACGLLRQSSARVRNVRYANFAATVAF